MPIASMLNITVSILVVTSLTRTVCHHVIYNEAVTDIAYLQYNTVSLAWKEIEYHLTRNRTETRHPENTVAHDWYTWRSDANPEEASCIREPVYHIAAPLLTRETMVKKFVWTWVKN